MMPAETVDAGNDASINMFTNTERRLLLLFYSGFVTDTIDALHQALLDIYDQDERQAAEGLIAKLGGMNDAALTDFILESEGSYV
jgi:hypothetical protein